MKKDEHFLRRFNKANRFHNSYVSKGGLNIHIDWLDHFTSYFIFDEQHNVIKSKYWTKRGEIWTVNKGNIFTNFNIKRTTLKINL